MCSLFSGRVSKHITKIITINGTKESAKYSCTAFIGKIPDEISYGDDSHLRIREGQGNRTIYERGYPKIMKLKKIEPVQIDKNGKTIYNIGADEVGADPFKAGRLAEKSRAGDEEARKDLERMYSTDMYHLIEDYYVTD